MITNAGLRQVDPVLTGLVNAAIPKDDAWIGLELARYLGVIVGDEMRTGTWYIEAARQYMGQPGVGTLLRAEQAQYAALHDDNPDIATYTTPEMSLGKLVDVETIAGDQLGLPVERAAKKGARGVLEFWEQQLSTLIFAAGTWSLTSTLALLPGGSGVQIGQAGAREFADFLLACNLARAGAHGVWPDYAIVGWEAAVAMATAIDLQTLMPDNSDRVLFSMAEVSEAIRSKLSLKKVFIASGRRETAVPGAASAEQDSWGDSIFFGYGSPGTAEAIGNGIVSSPMSLMLAMRRPRGAGGDTLLGSYRWNSDNPPGIGVASALFGSVQVGTAAGDPTLGYLLTDCVV